jgi:hypothetical protein
MSWQFKFLLAFAVIVLGTVLYLKRPPAMNIVASDTRQTISDSAASRLPSSNNSSQTDDLWNAIAPCWNRVADKNSLPTRLKLSFDASGGVSAPPEIERDPEAPITDQSLTSEAQALQALSECGAYPMAQGQQGVVVQFPPGSALLESPATRNATSFAARH